ncbi:ribose transport system permease protein [Roseiarcus fermentans]|uniref:Ribose transport system permease protein n=1 Tax=Roseiarcus fermentans TaxID=1473586 RepID=A0A366FE24_9HYPH|nr:ABC transporter permease [Roseiarcus fermentans]RBP12009.1 ribose transport system permease protein [Roseiarcus fermentans]
MSAVPSALRAPRVLQRMMKRNHGLLVAVATFVAVVLLLSLKLPNGFSYYDLTSTANSATALALAAIGETIVIIAGGLDLSAGAVISLANCLIAAHVTATPASMALWTFLGLSAGAAVGAFNGFLIVFLRLQPVIVTLATMFIVEGLTLLILEQPGGAVPPDYSAALTGDAIAGALPMSAVFLAAAIAIWFLMRATPFGTYLYAAGSDREAARAKGVPVRTVQFAVYVLAGVFYAAAGVFLTAQTGSGDPTVGPPMLLPIFVAVVLGGTSFAGGRGGCVGTVFGALTLMLIVNLLLVFNVPTYYASTVEGALLIAAVLSGSLGRGAPVWNHVGALRLKWAAWRDTGAPSAPRKATSPKATTARAVRDDDTLPAGGLARWVTRNAPTLRFVAPAYGALLLILVFTALLFGARTTPSTYFNSLLVLSSFMAVLALGQGAVVISGGLDLSMPAVITFAGILLTAWADASNSAALWAVPAVVVVGGLIGALNGLGIVLFGMFPLIMTLAMDGVIAGFSLVYSNGTPSGVAPPAIAWLMTGRLWGMTPVVFAFALFVAAATILVSHTAYGRRLKAVGASRTAAFFSGVPVDATLVRTYALSGGCSAIVGVMLVGFSGQAFNDMGEPYLLPAIAVVVIGGTLMTGGRGHFLGLLGGALLLTALTTVLTGLLLPVAMKSVIFGLVIVLAVLGLKERSA